MLVALRASSGSEEENEVVSYSQEMDSSSDCEDDEETTKPLSAPKKEPGLEPLWEFECSLTKRRTVNAMCWGHGRASTTRHDHVAKDLLAVGYGEVAEGTGDGLVLFWSLRNPQHPERVLKLPCGVTSLDFSTHHPYLIAVGLMDGSVSVFNIHKDDSEPVLDTSTWPGRHTEPVWQLKWVEKGADIENLVTISSDGKVIGWSMSKGLSATTLMELKRTENLQGNISNQVCQDL